MNPFSVLLLYPDFASDGPETFFAHVNAAGAHEAAARAREKAIKANPGIEDPDAFLLLAVIAGHHELELDVYDGV